VAIGVRPWFAGEELLELEEPLATSGLAANGAGVVYRYETLEELLSAMVQGEHGTVFLPKGARVVAAAVQQDERRPLLVSPDQVVQPHP